MDKEPRAFALRRSAREYVRNEAGFACAGRRLNQEASTAAAQRGAGAVKEVSLVGAEG